MKKIILIATFIFGFSIVILAKTTYIPTYYTQINIQGEGGMLADSTIRREMTMFASDGRYSITVLHDSVTAERVKAIKSMKAAAGWATAATILSGVSASLNPMHTTWDAVDYMQDMQLMASSSMLHVAAKQGAVYLQKVNVTIVIENLSDREMVLNDMKRGLTWFIPAHNYISLNVGNPEVNKLRLAYAECQEQKKDYITVQAGNFLEKHSIEYEDENEWVIPIYEEHEVEPVGDEISNNYERTLVYYELINKTTFEKVKMSSSEMKEYKRNKVK